MGYFLEKKVMEEKKRIRSEVRRLLREISEDDIRIKSQHISSKIEALEVFQRARVVGLFNALADEPDMSYLAIRHPDKVYLYPRVCGDDMEFVCADIFRDGYFGVVEPVGGRIFAPEEIDLVIVPGVAFDLYGGRLGRGRGFYDRYLGGCGVSTVGVCFCEQLFASIPMEFHDVVMDIVVSDGSVTPV